MITPTLQQLLEEYPKIAEVERLKNGRPCERTVRNVLGGTRQLLEVLPGNIGSPLTRKELDAAFVALLKRGVSRVTAKSYLAQYGGLFARWTHPYYADKGWKVAPVELPRYRVQPPRYVRPSAALLARVKEWYLNLKGPELFAATMMLEFAMRNGDVLRLGDCNFVAREVKVRGEGEQRKFDLYLSYTPHKTELSSGRRVCWPVPKGLNLLPVPKLSAAVFESINAQLRELGFRGPKASYELRKICIDHIYQRYGAEMASSISGDDIKTITHFYADPAQPNMGNVRVLDLL